MSIFSTWGQQVILAGVLSIGAGMGLPASADTASVNYNKDVLPIISEKCFTCHGPDEKARKKSLRFDTRAGILESAVEGKPVIVPGDPAASLFFQRIIHPDPDERMPPAKAPLQLSQKEIKTIRTWISEGAVWEGHWAFIPPVKPIPPAVSKEAWCKNPIDRFILQKLEEADLVPGQEAPREVLIRRVSLDLTGLPPTPAEVDAFLADTSEDAYENLVDRLLASPHYGERMAFVWLDAARYSDTNGYQRDTKRTMWPWRDWVIQAFNDDMPFDQFTIEQLAGDLLPNATLSQKIATGFNRNHRINGEGGIIPEEFAVEYVVDRVKTTSTTWMGLTMGCARCHDHKFDPFTQKEFYELYAFFDQVPEKGKGGERGNDKPLVEVPTTDELQRRAALTKKVAELARAIDAPDARLDDLQAAWESTLAATFVAQTWEELGAVTTKTKNGANLNRNADNLFVVDGPNPAKEVYEITFTAPGPIGAFKLDIFTDESLPETGPGRSPNGNVVINEFEVLRTPVSAPDATKALAVTTALADYAQENADYRVVNAIDGNPETGWATGSHVKRENRTAIFVLDDSARVEAGDQITLRIRQDSKYGQHAVGRFRLAQSPSRAIAQWAQPELGVWNHVGPLPLKNKDSRALIDMVRKPESGFDPEAVYGASKLRWQAHPEWKDGTVILLEGDTQLLHYLHRRVTVAAPTALSLSLGSNDAIKLWVDGDLRHVNNVGRQVKADQDKIDLFLEPGTHDLLIKIANYGGETGFYFQVLDDGGRNLLALMEELATPPTERSQASRDKLRNRFRARDAVWIARRKELAKQKNALEALKRSITTTMIMGQLETPRDTYLLKRGVYDAPDKSEKLFPSVPAHLGELDESMPKNRLGLAEWLMKPNHPLTARVRMNHYWQTYFGRGIVKTSEDFGTQGTPPTHQALLDWLAVTFIESGWDVKAMQKLIVMSATYRQSSVVTAAHQAKDPENLLLGRAPRTRLPAEMLRDQALTVAGLLNPKIGGPSVFPYQPDKMWSALTFQNKDDYSTNFYTPDTGNKLYRRGLYTFWKRTIAPPRMQIFDAAGRERCSLRNETTNTPMQALVLLNDPTFLEAARHLAQRMIHEGGERSADRIRYGYRLALAQEPSLSRQEILLGGLSDYQTHFNQTPEDVSAFIGIGDSEPDPSISNVELAAYTAVASVMLNLDEIITRE